MQSQLSILWKLLLQKFLPGDRRNRFVLFWTFAEPIGQMALLMTIFTLIGRASAYGRSFALFLITGLAILALFTRGAQIVRGAIMGLAKPGRPSFIGMFHEALVRVVFTAMVILVSMATVLYGVAVFNHVDTTPHHPELVLLAFLTTMALAFGVGLLRAWSAYFAPPLERVYVIISRALIFISGVFYMPSFLPPAFRNILSWNPVLHCVELMRLGVYWEYPTTIYDAGYVAIVAVGSATLGMVLLWRRRSEVMG